MKKSLITAFLILFAAVLHAEQFENPMLNMVTPSGLEDGQAYLVINHKFMRSLHNYPKDDLYAVFDGGANFGLDFRYMIGWGIEAKAGYSTSARQQTAGLSYTLLTPKLLFNSQLDVQFFTYRDFAQGGYPQNLYYLLSLQTIPFFEDRVAVSVDLGYDGDNSYFGMGAGLSVEVARHVRLLAEYYPVFNESGASKLAGNTGSFSFGVKIDTFGHQFMLKAGNSSQIGTRELMLGTRTQDIYIGLTIMRLIAF